MSRPVTKVYDIYFDQETQIVVMDWDGYATSEQFREGTEKMLEVLIENKASKVLADVRDMTIIGTEDQKWIEQVFVPKAIRQGFRVVAFVKPVSYFNKVAVESVSYKLNKDKMQISFFDTAEEAKAWLQHFDPL